MSNNRNININVEFDGLCTLLLIYLLFSCCSCRITKSSEKITTKTEQQLSGNVEQIDNSVTTSVETIKAPYVLPVTEIRSSFPVIPGIIQVSESGDQVITFTVDSTGKFANIEAKTKQKIIDIPYNKLTTTKNDIKTSSSVNETIKSSHKYSTKKKIKEISTISIVLIGLAGVLAYGLLQFILSYLQRK